MKVIGLTGGIGSGKSTVAMLFKKLGVPVYIADVEAKKLTNKSKTIIKKLIDLLGEETYVENSLNRKFVADIIFKDKALLKKVNAIIHPEVALHFNKWLKKQKGIYCIKEAAILFENGSYKNCDLTILVTAPKEDRIKRVMLRDDTTRESIEARINNQWSDIKKKKLAHIIIENKDIETTKLVVLETHNTILQKFSAN